MNSAGKVAVLLLLAGIAGCKHKVQSAAPPPAPSQVYFPSDVAKDQSLPQPPPPKPVEVKPPGSDVAQQPPPSKPKPKHHKAKPADSSTAQAGKEGTPAAAAPAQVAAAGQPADGSPIGQLSPSVDSGSALTRQQIQTQIANTENGLNGLKRPLTSDEKQTETEIRTFLAKAKKALDQDDLDGANTLVTKAKVLLDELTKG